MIEFILAGAWKYIAAFIAVISSLLLARKSGLDTARAKNMEDRLDDIKQASIERNRIKSDSSHSRVVRKRFTRDIL